MTLLLLASVILAGVNCVLAVVLASVYWKNHRHLRSPFTMGLLLFAGFLLVHNALQVYHYFTMMGPEPVRGEGFLLIEAALQTAASASLVLATLR